jgi:hypothetical protein
MRAVFESRNGNDPKFKSIINYSVKFYPELLKRLRNDNTTNRSLLSKTKLKPFGILSNSKQGKK